MVLEMEGIMLHHTKMSLLSVIGNWVNFLEGQKVIQPANHWAGIKVQLMLYGQNILVL
jgi:hypothetical protein